MTRLSQIKLRLTVLRDNPGDDRKAHEALDTGLRPVWLPWVTDMRALIIEDDSELRRLLRMSLEAADIETRTAADGKRGLALMKDTRFDFVVTDILMPTMDGLEVIQAVRAGHKDVKIIAISGGGRRQPGPQVLGMAGMLGADAILTKPFTRKELLAAVDAVAGNGAPV